MPDALSRRDAVLSDPAGTLLGLDFDGTLSHIVDDPTRAYAHPDSVAALQRLGRVLGQVAIVTGRPVAQALELGGFAELEGLENLRILGQYGAESWDATQGPVAEVVVPEPVAAVAAVLPEWLERHGAGAARLEHKGLAVAVHTRGLAQDVLPELGEPLAALAAEHGLRVEPGRQVVELRQPGSDKGVAVRTLVEQTGARQVVFAGDDLGDLPAFDAVDELREQGLGGLLVCSASAEQDALVARADVVLEGPDAVAAWLTELADDLDA
jgi:trehalose 6-phosphate phosphatase